MAVPRVAPPSCAAWLRLRGENHPIVLSHRLHPPAGLPAAQQSWVGHRHNPAVPGGVGSGTRPAKRLSQPEPPNPILSQSKTSKTGTSSGEPLWIQEMGSPARGCGMGQGAARASVSQMQALSSQPVSPSHKDEKRAHTPLPARLLPVPGGRGTPTRFPRCYLRCQPRPERGSAWMQPEGSRGGAKSRCSRGRPPGSRRRSLTCPPGPTEPGEGRAAPDGIMGSRAANPADPRVGGAGRASPSYREGGAGHNGAGLCGRGETEARSDAGGHRGAARRSAWPHLQLERPLSALGGGQALGGRMRIAEGRWKHGG